MKLYIQDGQGNYRVASEELVAEIARKNARWSMVSMDVIVNPQGARLAAKRAFRGYEREVFTAIWLNNQNQVIEVEELFFGTINQTSVHPREVVKAALKKNAAGVIFAHNHPSGKTEPSQADRDLTDTLSRILTPLDVRVLDHIIVTEEDTFSFAEHGMM